MGTSGAFKGSGGKDAGSLRDAISDWLGGADEAQQGQADTTTTDQPAEPDHLNPNALAPAARLWLRGPSGGSKGSGSGGGGATSGGGGSAGGGRSSGGVQRTVGRVSGPAGRAGALARAFATGDSPALEEAGLNYDELRALNDPLEVGRKITEVAFEGQPDGSIEDGEARLIVAELVSWIMDAPDGERPSPDQIVRYSIELMIAKAALTEVGDTIRKQSDPVKRQEAEAEVRRGAKVLAGKLDLDGVGPSASDIARSIETSVQQLVDIHGDPT